MTQGPVEGNYVIRGDVKYPIVGWLNSDGDQCEPEEAVVIVAGTEALGFYSILVADLERITLQ